MDWLHWKREREIWAFGQRKIIRVTPGNQSCQSTPVRQRHSCPDRAHPDTPTIRWSHRCHARRSVHNYRLHCTYSCLSVQCTDGLVTPSSVQHRLPVVKALLDSLLSRFSGIFKRLELSTGSLSDDSSPYSHIYYVIAPVLDPNYGLIWLQEDHPGDEEIKERLQEFLIGNILLLMQQSAHFYFVICCVVLCSWLWTISATFVSNECLTILGELHSLPILVIGVLLTEISN